jgi:hypothetical protein
MTQRGSIISTRPATPSYRDWVPEPYMTRAVEHLTSRHSAGLALDPGMRKTSITLEAFRRLQAAGLARTMLVIAPLRICRKVWRQEGAKWSQFRHLTFTLLHGDKKDEALKERSDIYLINPEGVEWLARKFFGRPAPFDVVTIDELTKFKNAASERSKALRPRLKGVRYRWGLTGSLAPNGYMDLFGQMLMLDDGTALGRYITHYRDQYFQLGYDGFTYELMPGAEQRIIQKIAPYWLQLSADDYLDLPELVTDTVEIELGATARKTYEKMKRDMIAALPEGIVTAANAAATYSKLSQMANGAVYVGDNKDKVGLVHDEKLDALEDLLEELNGQPFKDLKGKVPPGGKPLLLAYEFNHDFERLRERFGTLDPATGKKVLPYLGKGTTAKQEDEWINAWNRNELPIMAAHPASAGHGLNLQEGSAAHVLWFSPTWDLELWDQFIRRLRRSGNEALRIINHIFVCLGTIDELKIAALGDKDVTQSRLLKALNYEIRRDAETLAAQGAAVDYRRNTDMVAKLSRPGVTAASQDPVSQHGESPRPTPKGWGKPANAQTDVEDVAPSNQRERIQEKLQGQEPEVVDARAAFGGRIAAQREAIGQDAARLAPGETEEQHLSGDVTADKPTRTRRTRSAVSADERPAETGPAHGATYVHMADTSAAIITDARARLVAAVVASDPAASVEDILAASKELWDWVAAA